MTIPDNWVYCQRAHLRDTPCPACGFPGWHAVIYGPDAIPTPTRPDPGIQERQHRSWRERLAQLLANLSERVAP